MGAIRPIFKRRLRVSSFLYNCDVTSSSGHVIPLGVIIDLQVGDVYGLGLMARTVLSDGEAAKIGGLAREMLRRPFERLRHEFYFIWDSEDRASEFAKLPIRHCTALEAGSPLSRDVEMPRQLHETNGADALALKAWVEDQLDVSMRAAFWALMDEHPGSSPQMREQVRQAA